MGINGGRRSSMNIEVGKSYKTKDARIAKVNFLVPEYNKPLLGDVNGIQAAWYENGKYLTQGPHDWDLVELMEEAPHSEGYRGLQ